MGVMFNVLRGMAGVILGSPKMKGLLVTVDSFGTLYAPKKPIGELYLDVTRKYSIGDDIRNEDLSKSFKSAFKRCHAEWWRNGKLVGSGPRDFWKTIVNDTFRPYTAEDIPEEVHKELYDQFGTKKPYELFPDVAPFMARMKRLRHRYSDPTDPLIVLAVATNTDERTVATLKDFGFKVGQGEEELTGAKMAWARAIEETFGEGPAASDPDDFDFVTWSYATGYEKPHWRFWSSVINSSLMKAFQRMPTDSRVANLGGLQDVAWLHVGDDLDADYNGFVGTEKSSMSISDRRGFYINRQVKNSEKKDYEVSSLEEIAQYAETFASLNFDQTA